MTPRRRDKLAARWSRLTRWEYWPSWAVYAPLFPWWTIYALRARSITAWANANTAVPLRRMVGESKWDIHQILPPEHTVDAAIVEPGPVDQRVRRLLDIRAQRGWSWPIIVKPDAGERGDGVRRASSEHDLHSYFTLQPTRVIAQECHHGPHEIGVFYLRPPGDTRGRIFAVTDKRFATLIGDGTHTIAQLIWQHPRHRVQARVYLARLADAARRVPTAGESVSLGFAGNHAQGSMFLDGAALITPALTATFDRIADAMPGFHFGRFDIRYADPAALAEGRGFKIIELNSTLSEPTNVYDPSWGFWKAQRTLREAWRYAFAFGAANRARGCRPTFSAEILSWWAEHRRRPAAGIVAD